MKIIVSGASGFIGSQLVPALSAAGHQVSVWSRKAGSEKHPGLKSFVWDPAAGTPTVDSLTNVDVVVHLAGESVAHKWTDEVKKKIRDSRVLGTRNLVQGMAALAQRPKALICASATGYYGDRADEELTEGSGPGTGFLADVCREWEHEADQAAALGLRVVKIRTGVVLGQGGGALARMVPAFKTKMGGKLGSGKQWMPWIHLADLVSLYEKAIEGSASGVWNGTAPNPVRNEAFTEALGVAIDQPSKVTVPEFVLKMLFGEMAEVLLASQRVLPQAVEQTGFHYRFPEITPALRDAAQGH